MARRISVSDAISSRCLVQASGFGGGRAAPQGMGLAFQLLKIQVSRISE